MTPSCSSVDEKRRERKKRPSQKSDWGKPVSVSSVPFARAELSGFPKKTKQIM